MPFPISISKSANQFAVDLFQCYLRRHGDKYKNLLLCPYLIYHSLAMMLVGAKGRTAEQLAKLLRCSPAANTSQHKDFLILTEQLLHGNHESVHLASFIYLDKSTKRTDRYKSILRDYYETKPKKVEFENSDLMVKTVNEDVARTTENIYNDILSKQEAQKLEKSYMLLVNAVFFRGFWLSNFTDVEKAPFIRYPSASPTKAPSANQPSSPLRQQQQQQQPGSKSSKEKSLQSAPITQAPVHYNVNMMSKLDYLPIVSDEQLDARIVRMPFEASDLQMLLILPNDRRSDSSYLCEKISSSRITHIVEQFSKSKCKTVRISMPIFCIDSGKISIQSTLVQMGASDLFDQTKANLSGVCENKQIWLNKILHRCFIICDNRGSITSSGFEKAKRRQAQLETGISSGRKGLYTDPSETLEVIHENQLSPDEAHQIYTEGVYKT